VVLVMGLPAAGKSTLAEALVAEGYERLNRDELGGRLASLVPRLEERLAAGRTRVVLDNTYATRKSRAAVIAAASAHGVPVRCVFLDTPLPQAQVNAVSRLLARHGRLLEPAELRAAARRDPGSFGPEVLFRYERELEPPDPAEGFAAIDHVRFERRVEPASERRALVVWLDEIVWRGRAGGRVPRSADDVAVDPARAERLRRLAGEGRLLAGLTWQPERESGGLTAESLDRSIAELRRVVGVPLEVSCCPHAAGPPRCWCRKPLPGLAVELLRRHRLDPSRCLYVGRGATDRLFAARLGFEFREAADLFAG
jgi:predicted kinase